MPHMPHTAPAAKQTRAERAWRMRLCGRATRRRDRGGGLGGGRKGEGGGLGGGWERGCRDVCGGRSRLGPCGRAPPPTPLRPCPTQRLPPSPPSPAQVVAALAEVGAGLHAACASGRTALHLAAAAGLAGAVAALAGGGADLEARCVAGDVAPARPLPPHQPSLPPPSLPPGHSVARSQRTPLHVALSCGHVEAVAALLAAGVRVTRRTRRPSPPRSTPRL
jgi:hypothetical protein